MINKKENTTELLDNFEKNIDQITDKYTITRKIEDESEIRKTIATIVKKQSITEEINFDQSLVGLCCLLQTGAYLKSVSNRKINIANHEFTKKSLLYVMEQSECKYTLRNIAKHLNKTIALISLKYQIPGHLYARFKAENASLIANNSPEQNLILAAYCTDFQIENPDTPEIIRNFLSTREINRNRNK